MSAADKAKYDQIFEQMGPEEGGKVGGGKVAPVLKRSGLPTATLHTIWSLVDVSKDGELDSDWFAVAMYLAMRTKKGEPLPSKDQPLPVEIVPPSHR